MSFAGGLGVINAFQDAVVLANYLNSLPLTDTWKQSDITVAFRGYKAERYNSAKHACDLSHSIGQLTGKVKRQAQLWDNATGRRYLRSWYQEFCLTTTFFFKWGVSFKKK